MYMGLFKTNSAVGLELDTGVIRAVELKGRFRSASLTAVETIAIPKEAVVEGVVANPEVVAEALKELWLKARLNSDAIILGISNQGVLMRMASLPKVAEKNLARVIYFQAGDYFPIPLDQMVFDFSVVGESTGESGALLEVLLVAARRDLLDKSLGALDRAGLKPLVVDATPLALMRTLPQEKLAGTVVLANIANGLTVLMLATGGVPNIARVIPHSLQSYPGEADLFPAETVDSAARKVAVAVEEGVEQDDGRMALEHWGRALANEIRTTIGYYMAQRGDGTVDLVVLSGRGARIPDLPQFLTEELGVAVEVINPLTTITDKINFGGVDIQQAAPEFAVTIGLALRGLEY